MGKKALGICIGGSTVSFVKIVCGDQLKVTSVLSVSHNSNPKETLREYFDREDTQGYSVIVTGRRFRRLINTKSISEPHAVEEAFKFLGLAGKYRAVASLGGETFLVYCLDEQGNIVNVLSGNKCASGTGEFFLQQIRRMDINILEAAELANWQDPYAVSGRCSVFCKSDCTHALNKGIPKGKVVAGLCYMIANKIMELLAKQKSENILVIGGVAQNKSVISFIREVYPQLSVPEAAPHFEALGAALTGLEEHSVLDPKNLFKKGAHNFSFLPPLHDEQKHVSFGTLERATSQPGDECLLGLDVGSTTTKAVLIRKRDNALLASAYLRTNGNPVHASLECYQGLRKQIDQPVKIIGLGTTGSGRHIAGLHALTKGVINEIIAHAVAAAHFDQEVDTIFEIGGQDAKYTYLTNGVASDYAMNEACSAGTGSFLEEAARESLSIDYRDIADIALKADNPPNFSDQCAAFISSDIKTAAQEGIYRENVVAGLVYSICMNYVNRVKGNRSVGKKIFMQGGVCYNRAVPIAMAALINKDIVVPPEPGLMGAFGVALEVKRRIELGLLEAAEFDLETLIGRSFKYGTTFICVGGAEKCDRKCPISIIEVGGKKYPFGGACNRYYDQRLHSQQKSFGKDYVRIREDLVFRKYAPEEAQPENGKTIGILKSLTTNTFYPLYFNFFTRLGYRVVLSDKVDKRGLDKMNSAFCYPVEIAFSLFENLIKLGADYIFLPHIQEMMGTGEHPYNKLCVLAQAEPYYLKNAFSDKELPPILSPIINFAKGVVEVEKVFVELGQKLGIKPDLAKKSFHAARKIQQTMLLEFREIGREALAEIEKDEHRFGIVLFGRPYNSFAREANLGIPHKFATKNLVIIPHDFLDVDHLASYQNMYWDNGQKIIRAARFVKQNPKLFGVFITNFSCGPDSFVVSYFRTIMGAKPSLTLELDSHSADVGVNTRIEAALDIIINYMELSKRGRIAEKNQQVLALDVMETRRGFKIKDARGKQWDLDSAEVEVVLASMGRFGSSALAATFRSIGIRTMAMPVPTPVTLKYGRSNANCKECLPYILMTGQMVEHFSCHRDPKIKTLFFMPNGCGPCRQGQYFVKMKDVINELGYQNTGILTLSDENGYGGFGLQFFRRAWITMILSDLVTDVENALKVLAGDRQAALQILDAGWKKVEHSLEYDNIAMVFHSIESFAKSLACIPLKIRPEEAKVVSLIGEIYVRHEEFSGQELLEPLIEGGFVVRTTPVGEFIYYLNYLAITQGLHRTIDFLDRLMMSGKDIYQMMVEKKIRTALAKTGLVSAHMVDVRKTIGHARHLLSEDMTGEAILTVGLALREVIDDAVGIVSIGPFGCMPSQVAEAILTKEMTMAGKLRSQTKKEKQYPDGLSSLPYLHVETDGNPFPQITQSKIEIFMLQANKLHKAMQTQAGELAEKKQK